MNPVVDELNHVQLSDLVAALTAENSLDLSLRNAFFLTYPSFCTAEDVLRHLTTRYIGLDDQACEESTVCYFLRIECLFIYSSLFV